MFEKFAEYMFYLLNSPLKKGNKNQNQFYYFFKIIGKLFDDIKKDILKVREESMILTASASMLLIHAKDRKMQLYESEEIENFRTRLSMKAIIAEKAGTKEGVILAVKSMGYLDVELIPCYLTEPDRWAEFYVAMRIEIDKDNPVTFEILKRAVREVKQASAKDNYRFQYNTKIEIANMEWFTPSIIHRIHSNWWGTMPCFDGMILFDGSYVFEANIVQVEARVIQRFQMQNEIQSQVFIKCKMSFFIANIEKTVTRTRNRMESGFITKDIENKMVCRFFHKNILNEPEIKVTTKYDLWYFDGQYHFNGEKKADAYIKEEML